MKKLFLIVAIMVLLTPACAPEAQPTQQSVLPVDDAPQPTPIPTKLPPDLTPAQKAALSTLAKTVGLTTDKITLISTEAVTWPDGCLGVQRMGVLCTQAEVEGFKVILEADGRQFELHTNQNGSTVVFAAGEQESSQVVEAVVAQLAQNLGLNNRDITIITIENTEFADGCLGIALPDVMCAQVMTPGLILLLEANGIQYEYHASVDGSRIQPVTLALVWKREGGIAGFCDNMTVFLSGEVYSTSCKGGGDMGLLTGLITVSERDQFAAWSSEYGLIELDASDPEGASDRMVVTLNFFGMGTDQPDSADEDAMFEWAQNLFQKMSTR